MTEFSRAHVLAAFGCAQVAVKSAKVSPLNPKQWNVSLECGHDIWVTTKRKPRMKSAYCIKCSEALDKASVTKEPAR